MATHIDIKGDSASPNIILPSTSLTPPSKNCAEIGPNIIPLKIKNNIDGSFNRQDKNCETIAENNINPEANRI
ncbi:hypothetical protein fh0823_21920 [Francisella halioticida]|nr:hypothetical protein fh0823_21920 [Francisella halioticida]